MDLTSPWIVDGTEENFDSLVERSNELPVLIDLWSQSCQPCLILGPVLEKLAREYDGGFLLVKVNVDEQPSLAQAFRVQSIPQLFVLRNGQVVDQVTGAMPEAQLRPWLDQFQPSPIEQLIRDGKKLEATDQAEAETKYKEALELDPQFDIARIRLAKLYLDQHRNQDARTFIEKLEARGYLEPEAEALKAELEIRESAGNSGDLAQVRAAAAAAPDDLGLKLDLAEALAAAHQYPEALDLCLDLVRSGPGELRDKAKQTMVNMFQVIGNDSELTRGYRRKLSTALY